ncbi:WD40/YVTN/BNR-like repeat-containing protein, partial [candidate division KSB1 bacterium]
MKRAYSFLHKTVIGIFVLFSLNQVLSAQQIDMNLFSDIKARCIGPAGMSGRVATIDAVAENPDIFFVGAATGGLWKTVNGGITFKPVFDDQPVSSIGAVAIFQKNPAVVWVGTGEGGVRNSAGVGFGLYKSIDGGDTWNFMGLSRTERINRIVLHPENPDIAYVAAMGAAWGENTERGIYKTVDGGKNWNRILFINEKTGATDIVIDPENPNKLFASMWEYRRWPWNFKSGGEGSGLYVTYDGGENWKAITKEDGIPGDELGRIGIAIARSNPDVVYAVIESKKNVLLRSDDGGKSWETVNRSNMIHGRPFYYTNLRVDPLNENRLFSVQSLLWVSEDGGKNFDVMLPFERIHPDYHALWINPLDGRKMIAGNDGGIAVSPDRGNSWKFFENLPLAQFYHINIDNDLPYHVYGGLQDNGSWRGPGFTLENDGIRNYYWDEIAFGDGLAALPDPENSQMG